MKLKIGDTVEEIWIFEIRAKDGKPPIYFEVLEVWDDPDEGQMYRCKEGFGCAEYCRIKEHS